MSNRDGASPVLACVCMQRWYITATHVILNFPVSEIKGCGQVTFLQARGNTKERRKFVFDLLCVFVCLFSAWDNKKLRLVHVSLAIGAALDMITPT